ncbi:EAL domain-containing protein [Deferribacter abyssi]|uniref:EAL domain-containing protein n=1 Tax=Deferribacter abyssi TaxID=213806 RepID=UPI003C15D533
MLKTDDFISIFIKSNVVGFYVYQDNGIIVETNDCMAKILGFSKKEELLGHSIKEFLYENKDKIEEVINKRLNGDNLLLEYYNYTFKDKESALVYVDAISYTINFKGKYSGFVIVVNKTKEFLYLKLYKALYYINKLIVEEMDEVKLLNRACDILVNIIGYSIVGYGRIDEKNKKLNMLYSCANNEQAAKEFKSLTISIDTASIYGQGTVAQAYKENKVVAIHNIQNSSCMRVWKEFFCKYNIHSACSIPIEKDGKVKYILLIDDSYKEPFSDDCFVLLESIKENLSFALEKIDNLNQIEVLGRAIQVSHEWVLFTDQDGFITFCNDAVTRISSYNKKDLIGKKPNVFKSGIHDNDFYKKLWDSIKGGRIFSGRIINKRKDGSLYYLDKIIIPILLNNKIINFVDLSRDVTQLVKQQERLEFQLKVYDTIYRLLNMYIKQIDIDNLRLKLIKIISENLDIPLVVWFKRFNTKDEVNVNIYFKEKISISESVFKDFVNILLSNVTSSEEIVCLDNMFNSLNFYPLILTLEKNKHVFEGIILFLNSKNINFITYFDLLLKEVKSLLMHFEQKGRLRLIYDALEKSFDLVIVADKDLNITQIVGDVEDVLLFKEIDFQSKNISEISEIIDNEKLSKDIMSLTEKGGTLSTFINFFDKNGNKKLFYTTIVADPENKNHEKFIFLCNRLTNENKLLNEMDRLLNYDKVTGLVNRNHLKKIVSDYIKSIVGEDTFLGIVIVNPLSFADVNRVFGFNVGNIIINEIANRLKAVLRDNDIIAKLESDKFGIFLKELRDINDILLVINKIQKKLLEPFYVGGNFIRLYFTFGVVTYPKDGKSFEELMHRAQIALLDAKFKEDRVGFYNKDIEVGSRRRLEIKTLLEKALENKEIEVYYQPYVDRYKNIVGVESLLRWFKDGELIPTGDFIEYLESINLIIDVEYFVFENVIDCMGQLSLPMKFSVNVSKQTLTSPMTKSKLTDLLSRSKIDSSNLILEIVERIYFDNFEKILKKIESLKELGIEFSLDDFGTGYSSLSFIADLPVNYLKIDLEFVKKLPGNQKIINLVKSIIFMARQLNLKVIAEGVETEEQFKILRDFGCDYFQGFYFYKPMSKKDLLKIFYKTK